jgi:hypothetical protein
VLPSTRPTPAGPDAVPRCGTFSAGRRKGPTLQIKPRQAHIRPNGADNHFIAWHSVDGRHGLKSPCLSCSVHHTDNLQKATSADVIIGQVALIQCRPKTRFTRRAAPGHSNEEGAKASSASDALAFSAHESSRVMRFAGMRSFRPVRRRKGTA